jgi:hypothetical protein
MEIVDLRSDGERNRARRAQTPLEKADEEIATELAALSTELDRLDYRSDPYKERCRIVREIGVSLCANGGSDRMDLICYRVEALFGTSVYCRQNWDGVCGWYL